MHVQLVNFIHLLFFLVHVWSAHSDPEKPGWNWGRLKVRQGASHFYYPVRWGFSSAKSQDTFYTKSSWYISRSRCSSLLKDCRVLVVSHCLPVRLFPSWSCRMMNVPVSPTDAAAHTQPVELLVPRSLAVIYKYCTSLLKVYTHPYSHLLNCNSFTFSAPNTVIIFEELQFGTWDQKKGVGGRENNYISTLSLRTFYKCVLKVSYHITLHFPLLIGL